MEIITTFFNMNSKNNWYNANAHAKTLYASKKSVRLSFRRWKNEFGAFKMLDNTHYVYNTKKIFTDFRSIITDQNRRSQFEQMELENLIVKSILEAQRLKSRNSARGIRLNQYLLKRSLLKKFVKPSGTITRIRNRCVVSGRSSILGHMGLSRIIFRRHAGFGKIPGLLKI